MSIFVDKISIVIYEDEHVCPAKKKNHVLNFATWVGKSSAHTNATGEPIDSPSLYALAASDGEGSPGASAQLLVWVRFS
jgi:hypothetical protein